MAFAAHGGIMSAVIRWRVSTVVCTSMGRVLRSIVAFAALFCVAMPNVSAQTIPGISDSQLAQMKGCPLGARIRAQAGRVFGTYTVALHGSGQVNRAFFPNGAPIAEKAGVVWCAFVRSAGAATEYLLIRHTVYASETAAVKGFHLVLNMQNAATPDNAYTVSQSGKLTIAIRKYGEVMALRGDQLAAATWYVPAQQPDPVSRTVAGSRLVPVMGALLCDNATPTC